MTYLEWMSVNGKPAVDFVGRFERLDRDWELVCKRLGMPLTRLPHVCANSDRPHYTEYHDERSIQWVKQFHRKDLEAFPYRYGE